MPGKILLVDPDPNNQSFAAELTQAGYEVQVSNTGTDALPKIRLIKPDLVISELTLPKLNGLDMIRAIKENPSTQNTKILVFSSLADQEMQEEAKALGALEFLPKSVYKPGILTQAVKKHLP